MARVVVEGVPHHVTQRGHKGQEIFLLDEGRRFYTSAFRARFKRHGAAIPTRPESLARAIGQTHWRYTMRLNRRSGRSGHRREGRFEAAEMSLPAR